MNELLKGMIDFLSYIFNIIGNIWTYFWGTWIALGFVVVPILIIYLLFKHRKNKDEFFKILKPVVAFILFVSFYFLLMYCQRNVF